MAAGDPTVRTAQSVALVVPRSAAVVHAPASRTAPPRGMTAPRRDRALGSPLRENRTAGSARGDGPKKPRQLGEGTATKVADQQRGSAKATASRPVPTHHNISHHGLMRRVRVRIGDLKLNRLILAFLKSGVLSKEQFFRTEAGTPQGGILSPLLANIALSVLDERYSKYLRPKGNETAEIIRFRMKCRGEIVKVPIRYADDFLILVGAKAGPDLTARVQQAAIEEKAAIANLLREEMGLELSETKTLISQPTSAIRFLGHSVRTRYVKELDATTCVLSIPKQKSQELRRTIKKIFRRATVRDTLASRLELLNPLLRGWGYFYRHTWMARRVFDKLDYYVWWTILRWLRKKHPSLGSKDLFGRYCWRKPGGRAFYFRDGGTTPFELKRIQQRSYRLGWMKPPAYVSMSMESPVHNERCTPGSEGGGRRRVSES
ncbi:group II intron maturase-specific domain-containing protein [Sorangium sp. So ce1389]|uniref:group II intron maturase-specific domain-containing protein n=1 Tax=Sorangium sp. So ce1389 TaxID=3133336 RepID=UPI003F610A84